MCVISTLDSLQLSSVLYYIRQINEMNENAMKSAFKNRVRAGSV